MTINVANAELKHPFEAGSEIFDQPNVRYWEDLECPICEKITEHRRNKDWNLICIECGKHSVEDPLKRFQSKEARWKSERVYIMPKIKKQFEELEADCKQWFSNFESLDKEKYLDTLGKERIMTFTDFDRKRKKSNVDTHKLHNAKQLQTVCFYTVMCGSTMSLIDQDWWTKYFEIMDWINRENNEQ